MTRRAIKVKYGFEAKNAAFKSSPSSNVDLESRKFVMKIRDSLEPFSYEPSPPLDGVIRTNRPLLTLDNGAEYEGEWNE